MFAAKNEAEGDEQPERIMVRVKSNIGKSGGGFGYHIEARSLIERPDIEATRIVWESAIEGNAREILSDADGEGDEKSASKLDRAKWFVNAKLAKGERPQKEIEAAAELEGISERTLRRAAKNSVQKRKDGHSGLWFWRLH